MAQLRILIYSQPLEQQDHRSQRAGAFNGGLPLWRHSGDEVRCLGVWRWWRRGRGACNPYRSGVRAHCSTCRPLCVAPVDLVTSLVDNSIKGSGKALRQIGEVFVRNSHQDRIHASMCTAVPILPHPTGTIAHESLYVSALL